MHEAVNYLKVIYNIYMHSWNACFVWNVLLLVTKMVSIYFGLKIFSGSLTKKSKNRGVQMEELKLAPIIDFASGM